MVAPSYGRPSSKRAPVDAAARALLADRGYTDRVTVETGDMFEELPDGHDLHLLSHTLHDWDEEAVRRILGTSFAALTPGGWLADHAAHVNADKTGPLPIARYSVLARPLHQRQVLVQARTGGLPPRGRLHRCDGTTGGS